MVTTVAEAHLEAFENIEGIAAEKASIAEGLEPGGTAVLNGDIPVFPILRAAAGAVGAHVISFGENSGCHHRALRIETLDETTVAEARAWRTPMLYKVGAPGRHFAVNALGALAACWALGADRALCVHSLGRWTPYSGRGAHEEIQLDPTETDLRLHLIDDAYNANPASMAASLEVLAAAPVRHDTGRVKLGRRIAVLGDMKELGPKSAALHAGLAALPAMHKVDTVHCIGPLMRHLYDALPDAQRGVWAESSTALARDMRHKLDSGDVVMVKGSLSMNLARVVDAIRKMGHGQPDPAVVGPEDE